MSETNLLAAALLRAQKAMGNATKDSKNPFYKSSYADLNAIREAAIPVLNAEGISVLQPIIQHDGKSFVQTLLLHESGQSMASNTEIVAAKANDPQAYGSGISYARRYGLQSFLNIGAVDDDGERAMARPAASTAATDAPKKTSTFRKTAAPAAVNGSAAAPAVANAPAAAAKGWS